jgi:hypothetical protein
MGMAVGFCLWPALVFEGLRALLRRPQWVPLVANALRLVPLHRLAAQEAMALFRFRAHNPQ